MEDIINNEKSMTGPFLHTNMNIVIDRPKRKIEKYIEIFGAKQNNLKNIDVKIPLSNFVVVT
jgi:excinuclease ABC subunit A